MVSRQLDANMIWFKSAALRVSSSARLLAKAISLETNEAYATYEDVNMPSFCPSRTI
jgi:hypothetical protein